MADALRFCVLGPLEVLHSGGVLRIRSGKQRAILVMMLLDANHVVSTDALVDGLWGEEPPPTAAAALQTHMAKLRQALASVGGDQLVETRAPG